MPSPLGEGQVNTPIITFIWERSNKPLSRLPQGGEAFCSSSQRFSWKLNYPISLKRTQPHALSLGRGASQHADHYVYLGEVKPTCRSIVTDEALLYASSFQI